MNFKELSDSNMYYFPISKGSILPKDKLFQMTVSDKHPVEYNGLTVVKDQLQCGVLKLYFVVPEENFDIFPLQNYRALGSLSTGTYNRKLCIFLREKVLGTYIHGVLLNRS